MRIAVIGGTGTVGREVVAAAHARGHDAVVLARSTGVDVLQPPRAGLAAALAGADVAIDVASVGTMSAEESVAFFQQASRNLLTAAAETGIRHIVVLSIVGIDRNPHGYYAGKVAQEAEYAAGTVPSTILRATQFHEFAQQVAAQAKLGPLQIAPRARVQPIAASAVAERLVALAEGAPAGRADDIAGPHEEALSDMVRAWVRHEGRRGPVLPMSLPGPQMRGMRQGFALPGPEAQLLGPSFIEWLAERS
ncbi:MAG: NAD(P)H-binding protein [Candidatus Microbacterium phytovorans]|uniref:NAD(P)H-binding protein n=1 Tax=Candidatus Microbacterium phytovorans TaxID=3121374 RepID=A0AAJ5VZZ0_9MICO|nr:NAD(P)H-binding protein [Microbacterium sp.]WEK12388.1 MAG: NAD(P)H-binding protein [Microbacterium sp.]